MDLQKNILNLGDYFKEMNIVENVIYILVAFPNKWLISNTIKDNFNVNVTIKKDYNKDNKFGYYFFTDFNDNADNLFDAINYTINFNLQAEEKIKLLLSKIEELKKIFDEEDINTLKTLQFKYKKKKNKINIAEKVNDDSLIDDTSKTKDENNCKTNVNENDTIDKVPDNNELTE